MTTAAATVQLPHGWLFRDSAGNVGYLAADGKSYPLAFAIIDNPQEVVQMAYDSLKVNKQEEMK